MATSIPASRTREPVGIAAIAQSRVEDADLLKSAPAHQQATGEIDRLRPSEPPARNHTSGGQSLSINDSTCVMLYPAAGWRRSNCALTGQLLGEPESS